MTLFGSDQEAALLARAANLSRSSGAWLGLAYELYASPSAREGKDLAENVFTLVRPEDGSTALRYDRHTQTEETALQATTAPPC